MSDLIVLERESEVIDIFEKEFLPAGSKDYVFDTSYRCDKGGCGAQAYVKTSFKSGGHLLWCRHHVLEVEFELTPLLSAWYSEENRLYNDRLKGSEN